MKIVDLKIKGISSNSKEVKKDFVFVAIKGNRQDGNLFIREAIARGASVVVVEKEVPHLKGQRKVVFWVVNDCRKFFAQATHKFYGAPSDKVKVIGITGTNGKTTISYLVEAIAKESASSCGVIGTINYRFKGETIVAKNTTPGAGQLQSLLMKMCRQKVKYCAMEVSSHALDQERVGGINFSCAIFTNLTQDHLDYHKNFENYFQAKAKLFSALAPQAHTIINNDDQYGNRLKQLTKAKIWTYAIKNKADLMAKNINFSITGTEFTLVTPGRKIRIKTKLIGRHNIYNILAAASWGLSEKLQICDIKSAIEKFENVPGRLQRVDCSPGLSIFVDYAHTPDALFNVISALRPLVKGKLVVVFGCGGERDKLKRPLMGRVVTELADFAVITSDNPRCEDPVQIIKDIQRGIRKNNYCAAVDRRQAIRKGLSLIKKGDCLLLAGKGHEECQILKRKVVKFNDRKVVRECLKLMI
ncbi:MAG: UDP-N-acetylmuramoyl-L-alanyl-D-glutamate--2,6-diaminopimelate ligase [Candidatus Omnitrophica bacterium CG11_big_fil_rev_8_21_14_0_20_43_6]|nr:MAG: UDP-N-acetylmuramoyl-L-alanyl-D-glutamate--2,6-diaminopimelate ligase [Candidatus Omnitrophica bacterium CG11_big_fil_rev_8_21_14_0_20_43_6]